MQLTRMAENDYIELQINSAAVPALKGMLTEIITAGQQVDAGDNFNLQEVQDKMRTYSKKIAAFFTETEWIFKIFSRAEIERLILRNARDHEFDIY